LLLAAVACGGEPDLPFPSEIAADQSTDNQQVFAGARLPVPLAVTVTAADGRLVARAEVQWRVLAGADVTVSDSVTVTDGTGRAEVDVTLGSVPGVFSVRATLKVDEDKAAVFTVEGLSPPSLTGVIPLTFAGGDTLALAGLLLSDSLTVEIGGATAQTVAGSVTEQAMSVVVPECLVLGSVTIQLRYADWVSNGIAGSFQAGTDPVLTLELLEYVSIDPAAVEGCATFGLAPGGALYLLVPQSTAAVPGATADYRLTGDSAQPTSDAGPRPTGELDWSAQFHGFLRGQEREFAGLPKPAPIFDVPVGAPAQIEVGDRREFRVCNTVTCSDEDEFSPVTAEVRYVGTHAAIYLDVDAPDTLSTAIFQEFGQTFDQDLYEVATRAFGAESDVDENDHVLILMTPVVNQLTPIAQCETSIITGFFFALDVDPSFRNDSRSNQGEVFYALTPDPAGTISCDHSVDRIRRLVPVTFMHELQHMISYNQHVLVRQGPSEVLWLNEGMSHLSEEIAALHFDAMGDQDRFSQFAVSNLFNAFSYLKDPGATFVLFSEGAGSLAERGGSWLLLRWLVDQFGEEVIRRLSETSLTGAANIADAAGEPFSRLVSEWILANWVSDSPDISPRTNTPPRLQYRTWQFRSTFQLLHDQLPDRFDRPFPIVPRAFVGGSFYVVGVLRAGSGDYLEVEQLATQGGFTLRFQDPTGGPIATAAEPRLNVIRMR
jgi:hypothetical protein